MKKGKLILAAIAAVAIVGGALAFKAARGTSTLYYYDTVAHKCTAQIVVPFTSRLADAIDPTPITTLPYYTTSVDVANQTCPATTLYLFN